MDNKEVAKQMIDIHKKTFENCFAAMVNLQNQAEKMMTTFVDFTPGMTDEGKKVMEQLNSMYKKNRDEFKKAVDEGYEKLGAFFNNDTVSLFQDQAKKMFDLFSNQKTWLPFDFKKTMEDMGGIYKKGCDDFKKQIDENLQRMEKFYTAAGKPNVKK